MQKKNLKAAHTAAAVKTGNAGKTGTTGKTGKTGGSVMTAEQRKAKRLRDRKYRNKIRKAKKAAAPEVPGRHHCGCTCQSAAGSVPRPVSADDVFRTLGRLVIRELAREGGLPRAGSMPVSYEPGVTRQDIVLPDGSRVEAVIVDADKVDPLSPYSPLPAPLKAVLLRSRMAREISDIVDSHLGMS